MQTCKAKCCVSRDINLGESGSSHIIGRVGGGRAACGALRFGLRPELAWASIRRVGRLQRCRPVLGEQKWAKAVARCGKCATPMENASAMSRVDSAGTRLRVKIRSRFQSGSDRYCGARA